jgi:hypothetical protein
MRLRVTPFTHPEYLALHKRNPSLALLWSMGHAFMVVFLAMALVLPLGVAMRALTDSKLTLGRARDLAVTCMTAALIISATGFAVRRYAKTRGNRLPR